MGRPATKALGNRYYEARISASKWDERLSSRAGAAEAMNVSEDVVKDAELGLYKCLPVDTVVRMADLYHAPELLNYYCLHECPIGKGKPISDSVVSIERVTVSLIKHLRVDEIDAVKDVLIDIAEDGVVSEDEVNNLLRVRDYQRGLSRTISEMEILAEKASEKR